MTTIGSLFTGYGGLDMGGSHGTRPRRAGTRSGLWESIAAAVETTQPRLVVWENMQGALSARAYSPVESETTMLGTGAAGPALRAAGRVTGDLADLGYDCRWQIVRASDAEAPTSVPASSLLATPTANLGTRGDPQHPEKRRASGHSVSLQDQVTAL